MVDHRAMKAYSEDLRKKVVEAVQQRGTSAALARRSSLRARMIVQGNHTASSTH